MKITAILLVFATSMFVSSMTEMSGTYRIIYKSNNIGPPLIRSITFQDSVFEKQYINGRKVKGRISRGGNQKVAILYLQDNKVNPPKDKTDSLFNKSTDFILLEIEDANKDTLWFRAIARIPNIRRDTIGEGILIRERK